MTEKTLANEVRESLKNALENGHDLLTHCTDSEIADDIIECTGVYENIRDDLVKAVGVVRSEGL